MADQPIARTNPYIGPRSFQTGERLYGRDNETKDLLGLLIAERIVLLHSPSGAGKTSLIQAALLPQLQEQEFDVMPILRVSLSAEGHGALAAGPRTNRYLLSLLLSLEESLPPAEQRPLEQLASMTFDDYLRKRPIKAPASGMVLIFDQFEEILTLDPTDHPAKQEFFTQVGVALRDRKRWALFVMREDYVASLAPFLRPIPTRLATTFRLDLLGTQAALDSIREPAREVGVAFDEAAAGRLIDDLCRVYVQRYDGQVVEQAGPYVEPVQLQVVCYRLWARLTADDATIHLNDVHAAGDVSSALADYYAERVAEVAQHTAVSERTIREWFDRALITPQGIRGQVLQGEGTSQGLDNHAIWALVDAYLARAEKRRGATWFELAHDRLIEPVRRNNSAWFTANLSPLQRQADLWVQQARPNGLLFDGALLAEAEAWATIHAAELTANERAFLDLCHQERARVARERRANRAVRVLALVSTALLLVALLFFFQARADAERATRAQRAALSRQLIAQSRTLSDGALDQALLLALAAGQITDNTETRGALLHALMASPALAKYEPPYNQPITAMTVLPNGTQAVLATNGTLIFQPDTDPAKRFTLATANTLYTAFAFAPNGQLLVTGDAQGTIRRWNFPALTPIGTPLQLHQAPVCCLAISPNAQLLASGDRKGTLAIWNITQPAPVSTRLAAHQTAMRSLAFSPDSRLLATGYEAAGNLILLWDAATGQPKGDPLAGHDDQINSLAFSPDGAILASASTDRTIRLWEVATQGALGNALSGHQGSVTSLAFSPDGTTLVSASNDRRLLVWNVADHRLQGDPLTGHAGYLASVVFLDNGTLRSAGKDGQVIRWTLPPTPRLATIHTVHKDMVMGLAYSPDSKTLITGGCGQTDAEGTCTQGELQFWDVATRTPQGAPVAAHTSMVLSVATSPDGRLVASGAVDGSLMFWDSATHQPSGAPITAHTELIYSLAFSPDGSLLASAGADDTVRFWDVATRTARGAPSAIHQGDVLHVAFSPDGTMLASSDDQGFVVFWDTATRQPIGAPLKAHAFQVNSLAFSPDGHILATASQDTTVILWNVATRTPLGAPLVHHRDSIISMAFSPDGTLLATASLDQTILLWDVATHDALDANLAGIPQFPSALAYSPDGRTLAVGYEGAQLAIWDIDPAAWRTRACTLTASNLTPTEWRRYVGDTPFQIICPK